MNDMPIKPQLAKNVSTYSTSIENFKRSLSDILGEDVRRI